MELICNATRIKSGSGVGLADGAIVGETDGSAVVGERVGVVAVVVASSGVAPPLLLPLDDDEESPLLLEDSVVSVLDEECVGLRLSWVRRMPNAVPTPANNKKAMAATRGRNHFRPQHDHGALGELIRWSSDAVTEHAPTGVATVDASGLCDTVVVMLDGILFLLGCLTGVE